MKGTRVRLWKIELQKLANQSGLAIFVAHHPPGTSKWNCIAHRMFAVISQNWRGKPLLSHQLIAATRTATGLAISCAIDAGRYPKGAKVPDPNSPPPTSNTMLSIQTGATPYFPKIGVRFQGIEAFISSQLLGSQIRRRSRTIFASACGYSRRRTAPEGRARGCPLDSDRGQPSTKSRSFTLARSEP